MTNGSLMKVESIAERPPWSILQYFCPGLSDNWSWKSFLFFLSGRFTQVLLYSFETVNFEEKDQLINRRQNLEINPNMQSAIIMLCRKSLTLLFNNVYCRPAVHLQIHKMSDKLKTEPRYTRQRHTNIAHVYAPSNQQMWPSDHLG